MTTPGAGDNLSRDVLRSLVERVERIEEEVYDLNSDKSDIYKEAKSQGFDPKILKRVVAWRRKDRNEAVEEDAIFAVYMHALGHADETGTVDATRARTKPAAPDHIADAGNMVSDTENESRPGVRIPRREIALRDAAQAEAGSTGGSRPSPAVAAIATVPAAPDYAAGVYRPRSVAQPPITDRHGLMLDDIPANLRRVSA